MSIDEVRAATHVLMMLLCLLFFCLPILGTITWE